MFRMEFLLASNFLSNNYVAIIIKKLLIFSFTYVTFSREIDLLLVISYSLIYSIAFQLLINVLSTIHVSVFKLETSTNHKL